MTASERLSVSALALLYAMRMLGLFMVLPVFVLLGADLEGATPLLIGLAMGSYGLSQAFLQIPFGMLSDRFGRKPLILIGLALFFCGSVVAGASDSVYGVIAGRFLQGAGAIASVLMALVTDLTTEESRTRAMAVIGMSIGISFSVALVLGPMVGHSFGLSGIFYLTSGFAVLGAIIVIFLVPTPVMRKEHRDTSLVWQDLGASLKNLALVRLDAGIFLLHMILTATFMAVPLSLVQRAGLDKTEHWAFYLSVMVLAFLAMIPFIVIGERRRRIRAVFLGGIALLVIAMLLAHVSQMNLMAFWGALFLFFMAFNLLEAVLPSLVSKLCLAGSKGTAMGVYSTSQFLGAFGGGALGGFMLSSAGLDVIYLVIALAALLWFFIALPMQEPNYSTSMILDVRVSIGKHSADDLSGLLRAVAGVEDAIVLREKGVAYLKVDKSRLDSETLLQYGKASVPA